MAIATPAVPSSSRLPFIDNIRWAMIVLVIFHHSAVTYSHVGSWFYNENPEPGLLLKLIMATFLAFNQAYFMGFLFLIAGYFAAPSLDRKGPATFIRDRCIRLGIPSLIFMLVLYPAIVYWMLRDFYQPERPSLIAAYPAFLSSGRVFSASGPMWFALALLLFCLVYAAFRTLSPSPAHSRLKSSDAPLPGSRHLIGFIAVLALTSFVVRIFQPVGTSILNMQLCYFSQYVFLFALGIAAYRRNWLLRIPYALAMRWFGLALGIGLVLWIAVLASGDTFAGHEPVVIFGGLHWQSLLNCVWESFVCVGLCLGVLVLFRDRIHIATHTAAFFSRNAFSAYLFHTPVLISVTLSLQSLAMPVLVKFIVAGILATAATFLASEYVFRRIPLLNRVL